MKERPILMSGPNIQPILECRKTQTRRVVKSRYQAIEERDDGSLWPWREDCNNATDYWYPCPYGQPGDRLWVRETWADTNGESGPMISYRAGGDRFLIDESFPVQYEKYQGCQFTMWCGDLRRGEPGHAWKSPLFMPRWASRILLEITDVRVERLHDITPTDAMAEGVEGKGRNKDIVPDQGWKMAYRDLWESINGAGSWDANPWVWVISFGMIKNER